MNDQEFRTFKSVAEYQSLSRAAQHLSLSLSAVSQHIRHMEQDYGTGLFVRTAHGMQLTEAGELVYRDVCQILTILGESRQRLATHQGSRHTKLTIGASLTIAEYLLPYALQRLDDPTDRQNILVHMANSHDVVAQVLAQSCDIGLVEAPVSHTEIAVRPFLEDRLKVVVSSQHSWAPCEDIGMEELLATPLIIREPGSGTRQVLEESLRQVGVSLSQLNIRFVLSTTQAIKAMVSRGLGASVLSPYTIHPEERHHFHTLTLREASLSRHFSLVHRHSLDHALAQRLVRILFSLNWGQELTPSDAPSNDPPSHERTR